MLNVNMIQKLLNECTLKENDISKDILVPCLQKISFSKGYSFREAIFVGGTSEQGVDIEYYEIIGPFRDRLYTGIQVKKKRYNIILRKGINKSRKYSS